MGMSEASTAEGKIHVPYERIHTEFDLLAAA